MQLGFLVPIAVSFAVRQSQKFGKSLDMVKLRADFETRVRDLVPGSIWDDAAVALTDKVFAIFADLFTSDVLEETSQDLVAGKFAEALAHVEAYVLAKIQK